MNDLIYFIIASVCILCYMVFMILKFNLRVKVTIFIVLLHLLTALMSVISFSLLLLAELLIIPLSFLGIVFVIIGIVLIVSAVKSIHSQAVIPKNFLVTKGLYSRIRNPIYLGFMVISFSVIFFSFSLYLILYFLFLVFVFSQVVNAEERELLKRFGKKYDNYRKKVPSFIPRL